MRQYAAFKEFYAGYWAASPSTFYKVVRYSNSGASAYIERDGRIQLVPVSVLQFTTILAI